MSYEPKLPLLMKKFLLPLLLFLLLPFFIKAQLVTEYKPIESTGKIPDEFISLMSEKIKSEQEKINLNEKAKVKKDQKQFLLESNYMIDNLLLSGKVVFNDPISTYTNKVLSGLLQKEKGLENVRVYTIKSPAVNAFATDNGIILVTIGLLAQLENEAQLAYILSHELSHYKFGHSMNSYLEGKEIQRREGKYNDAESIEDQLIKKNNYSKELEKEADLYGFEIYSKSNYSYSVLPGVFDVLEYSYLPFDLIEYDKAFLESKHIKFPSEYFLDEISEIGGEKDYDSDKSTHPSVNERRTIIKEKTTNLSNDGRKEFLIDEEEFSIVRKLARFELTRLHLLNQNYGESLYNSYLLSKQYDEDVYVKKSILQALYGLAKYANSYSKNDVLKKYKDVEGFPQQLFHQLNKMKSNELTILALTHSYELEKQLPNDNEVKLMTNDLMKELVKHHQKSLDEFYDIGRKELTKLIEEKSEIEDTTNTVGQNLSKYEKIKKQRQEKKEEKVEKGNDYFLFAFVDFKKEEAFTTRFGSAIKEVEEEKSNELSNKEKNNIRQYYKRKGYSLGIDKIVFVEPYFFHVNHRKRSNPVNFIANENRMRQYHDQIKISADKVGLDAQILDGKNFDPQDVDAFNDLSLLNEWVNEKMTHDMDFVTINNERIKELAKKYDTKYFAWTGIFSSTSSRDNIGIMLFYTIIFYPLLPYGIYYAITPENTTKFATLIFDLEEEEYLVNISNEVSQKSRKDVVNSNLYYFMKQIKRK